MSIKPLVLVIEDEEMIRNLTLIALTANNYRVISAKTGKEGVLMAMAHAPAVILLDLRLPDLDGLEVLKSIRERSITPVIVDSARGNERDEAAALNMGADDYIIKPFTTCELLARIRAVIRRRPQLVDDTGRAVIGGLEIDYNRQEVFSSGQEVRLTPVEYKLLALLSKNAGRVLTHDFIIKEIWGSNADGMHSLHVAMANIRRKIESNPAMPKYVLAEIGIGYRMAGGCSL